MRLVAWNLNHRIRQMAIPWWIVPAIAILSPDVLVLTEYVPGPSHEQFLSGLSDAGLRYSRVSRFTAGQNHILIAARLKLEPTPIAVPSEIPYLNTNTLCVEIPDAGFRVLGLRVPYFKSKDGLVNWRRTYDWACNKVA